MNCLSMTSKGKTLQGLPKYLLSINPSTFPKHFVCGRSSSVMTEIEFLPGRRSLESIEESEEKQPFWLSLPCGVSFLGLL